MTTATNEEKTAQPEVEEKDERLEQAMEIVHRNMAWAAGGGLIVVPFLDIAAVTSVQLKMIKELSNLYEIPFSKKLGRSLIASILGGAGSSALAYGKVGAIATGSLMKVVPVVGTVFGAATMSVFSTGITYGVGKVFIKHFADGGNLEDLDVEKAKKEVHNTAEKHVQDRNNARSTKKGLFSS
ncbi:YcjF family protein [Candidatus Uabimicrobium sp. HlEnr_7]|uniref:YcjF family protein n=1 Tax=Candidatus Uabimicrobium helgolandensis TaxID=3095367 RepID=UPI0035574F23